MNEMTPRAFATYTFGCKVNQYESRAIEERLLALGFVCSRRNEPCDLILINTCAVTAEGVRKAKQTTRRLIRSNPDAFVILMGCATQAQAADFGAIDGVDVILGTRNKNLAVAYAESFLKDGRKLSCPNILIVAPNGEMEQMTISGFDRTRAYVKIQDGCNGKCAYCIIPSVRGGVVSRRPEQIADQVRALVANGCHEVVLTGIETSAYQYGLADLIEAIASIDGIERIRLGSLDPSVMTPEFVDRIAAIPAVAPHFHLSLQSGSNAVLKRMRRRYLIEKAIRHITYLREKMPQVQLSTDLIVGFPGETEEEFEETVRVAQQIGFLHSHIFPYSKRPGTLAAEMDDQVDESVKTKRAARLTSVCQRARDRVLEEILSRQYASVLVETRNKNGEYSGHSAEFAEVLFTCEKKLCKGQIVRVRLLCVRDGRLYGIFEE